MGIEVAARVAKPKPFFTIMINVLRSHGKPRQNKMSNIFDPIELHIAISARPARFTMKYDEINSGILVPAAKIVIPETVSEMQNVYPINVTIHTIR